MEDDIKIWRLPFNKKNKTTYPKKNNNEDNLTQKERERGPKLK